MMPIANRLLGLTLFVVLHGTQALASSYCELLFYKLPSKSSNLLEEMKSAISRAARRGEPLLYSSVSLLRSGLESLQNSVVTRMQENGKVLFESNQPLVTGLNAAVKSILPLTAIPENEKGRPLDSKAIEKLLVVVNQKGAALKKEQQHIEILEAELRRNLRLTQNLIQKMRRAIQEIQTLEVWLLMTHEQTPLITMESFRAELRIQRNLLEDQMRFLESFYARFDQALVHVIESNGQIKAFFSGQWPMLQLHQLAGHYPMTNLVPKELPLEMREKAFSRSFFVGDRLIVVREQRDYASLNVRREIYRATYAQQSSTESDSGTYPLVVGVQFEGIGFRKLSQRKVLGITFREAREVPVRKEFFLPDNLNSPSHQADTAERFASSFFFTFLADPKMNIDGYSLGETIELDAKKALDSPQFHILGARLQNPIKNSVSFKVNSNKPFLDGEKFLKGLLETQGQRSFAKILGTNPVDNSVLVAFWTADQTLGQVSGFSLRRIMRNELAFFKPFDEHFFFWPEIEKLNLNPQAAFAKPERM